MLKSPSPSHSSPKISNINPAQVMLNVNNSAIIKNIRKDKKFKDYIKVHNLTGKQFNTYEDYLSYYVAHMFDKLPQNYIDLINNGTAGQIPKPPKPFVNGTDALTYLTINTMNLEYKNYKNMQQPHQMTQQPHQMTQQPHQMMQQPHQMTQQPQMMQQPHQMTQQPHQMTQQPQMMQQPHQMTQQPQMMQQPHQMTQQPQMPQKPQMMQQPQVIKPSPQLYGMSKFGATKSPPLPPSSGLSSKTIIIIVVFLGLGYYLYKRQNSGFGKRRR